MILTKILPASLRANSAARICHGSGIGELNYPSRWISGSRISLFTNAAFSSSSSYGERNASPTSLVAVDATKARSADLATVIALPLYCYPLFPSNNICTVKDPVLLASLNKNRKIGVSYAGAFLLKDKPLLDQGINSLKGKELLKHLHDVGTLIEIIHIHEDGVRLRAHSRLRIVNMVEEDPLTVTVKHLKDRVEAHNIGDDEIDYGIHCNLSLKPHMDKLIFKFKLLSDMDFYEVNSSPDAVVTQMLKGDDSYIGACADELASLMKLNKWLKQRLLEYLYAFYRFNMVLDFARNHVEYQRLEANLRLWDFDFEQLFLYYEENVSSRPYILSECRSMMSKLLMEAKVDTPKLYSFSGGWAATEGSESAIVKKGHESIISISLTLRSVPLLMLCFSISILFIL